MGQLLSLGDLFATRDGRSLREVRNLKKNIDPIVR